MFYLKMLTISHNSKLTSHKYDFCFTELSCQLFQTDPFIHKIRCPLKKRFKPKNLRGKKSKLQDTNSEFREKS